MSKLAGLDKNSPSLKGMSAFDSARARSEGTVMEPTPIIPAQSQPEAKIEQVIEQIPEPVIETPSVTHQEPLVSPPAQIEAPDPYAPLKTRLGDRPLDEWLSEVDTATQERDEFRRRNEVAEMKAKELEERLIQYDVTNDPEFKAQAIEPINRATEEFRFLLANDDKLVNEVIQTFQNPNLDPASKSKMISEFANEWGVTKLDVYRAYENWAKAHVNAKAKQETWQQSQVEREKQRTLQMEESHRQNVEMARKNYSYASLKALNKIKELGLPINGFEEAREGYLLTVESALQARPADTEMEATYSLLGRAVYNSRAELTDKLNRLAKLDAASRIDPAVAARAEAAKQPASTFGIPRGENPITKRNQIPV